MKKIDFVIISSDDTPLYKDFYPIVAEQWYKLGFQTYYINITDKQNIVGNKWGIVHSFKAIDGFSTGFQSQIIRLFAARFINGNILTSDIDMLPLNKDYFNQPVNELTNDNIILYSGQPYGTVPYYPMCYVLSNTKTLEKCLGIENDTFETYCKKLHSKYGGAWNTDEHFMYDQFQNHLDKLIIKPVRDRRTRIDRSKWEYDINLLKQNYYIDSHLVRPYSQYSQQIDKLINDLNNG